jgi:hypothetical protein
MRKNPFYFVVLREKCGLRFGNGGQEKGTPVFPGEFPEAPAKSSPRLVRIYRKAKALD